MPFAALREVSEGLWVYFCVSLTACMIGRTVMIEVMRHIIHISNVVNVGFSFCMSVRRCVGMSYWNLVALVVSGTTTEKVV